MRVGKIRRNGFGVDRSLAALNLGRVGNIQVVRNSTVFLIKAVVVIEKGLPLIPVAYIAGGESPGEILYTLIGVRTL